MSAPRRVIRSVWLTSEVAACREHKKKDPAKREDENGALWFNRWGLYSHQIYEASYRSYVRSC